MLLDAVGPSTICENGSAVTPMFHTFGLSRGYPALEQKRGITFCTCGIKFNVGEGKKWGMERRGSLTIVTSRVIIPRRSATIGRGQSCAKGALPRGARLRRYSAREMNHRSRGQSSRCSSRSFMHG
ncbi:hypothetical protein HN011_003757 [Eciton burchellii]|nr:hypothetical protein HN011_003757 [Eciton burchellii]